MEKLITMASNTSSINIGSFNSRGLNQSKRAYIVSLFSKLDILFLHEHWLSDAQLAVLGNIAENVSYTGVSGFSSSDILTGRPYGGCAILWRSNLTMTVTELDTGSNRICAVRFCSDSWKLILHCVRKKSNPLCTIL